MLHLTDVGTPVGKEHHTLVHLHPLALQKFEETALGLLVIRLDESEATAWSILGQRFADDHFEVRFLVFPLPRPEPPLTVGIEGYRSSFSKSSSTVSP
jgi:hypothetical protein